MDLYRISSSDLKSSQLKIDTQRNYLSSNSFMTVNGELKSYLDISMSANISSRYYAQLVNKVNTLQQVMLSEDLEPIFLTLTLDGVYHDLIMGKYSRFSLYHQKKLPENDINGYLQTKASNREIFNSRDLYQLLRFQWRSFQNSRTFRQMKKDGYKVGYLFAVEPHKSGVPHAHVLLYVPSHYIGPLKDVFIKCFWAKQNLQQSKARLSPTQIRNGEINGYQWTLSNAVGYVMKYCTKSFMDLKNQKEIDELQAWYIKHKIIRITMSHTLVPQWVYNKIYPLESDWNYLSDLNINSTCEWSQTDDTFEFIDNDKNQVLRYEKGLYQRFVDGVLREEFGTKKVTIKNSVTIDNIDFIPLSFSKLGFSIYTLEHTLYLATKKIKIKSFVDMNDDERKVYISKKVQEGSIRHKKRHNPPVSIKIVEDGIERNLYKNSIPYLGSMELLIEYTLFDVINGNMQRFTNIQNELIKRKLIKGKIQSLNQVTVFDEDIDNSDFDLSLKKALFSYSVKDTQFKQNNSVIVDLYTSAFYKVLHRFDRYKIGV
ncbi:hypothetical protein [Sulfurimonas sp.]|uniref:rolling circle replication-associated protein n=1 Tax=Sulfurimonas sp. TaxID=2022749 RepID=UPI0025D6A9DE|nr:hypothetical protein [Sulfurimonas sp.]